MRLSLLCFLTLFTACSAATSDARPKKQTEPSVDTPVATWEGGQITAAELDAEVHNELVKLETDYLSGMYQARSRAIDMLAVEKMLEAEAASRSITVDALLAAEVEAKISPPTDAEMQQLYPSLARRMGEIPFEQARPYLVQELIYRKQVERYGTYIGELKTARGFESSLEFPELPRVEIALADHDPMRGASDAEVTIVQFAEYACHYCGVVSPTLDTLLERYAGKVKLVFKDYPLRETGPSISAAVAAHCAGEQDKYWEMNKKLLANQQTLGDASYRAWATELGLDEAAFGSCLTSGKFEPLVREDAEAGQALGVNSTPTFFVNGLLVSGAQPVEQFAAIIDRELGR